MDKILKRDGRIVQFDEQKIRLAILKAFEAVDGKIDEYAKDKAEKISNFIKQKVHESETILRVEEIQDLVEHGLMSTKRKEVARAYITYRNERTMFRGNSIDQSIEELVSGTNDYWNNENSNKNPVVVSTQRDYLAGIVSTDIARRKIFSKDVIEAHDNGAIHIHDMDYMAQNALSNCCLINLDDMLQNGTCINRVTIEKPHRLLTAATIATQIITTVTSSQYGGATISLSHLAPFVRDSYNYYLDKYKERGLSKIQIEKFAQEDLRKEISDAVQTFNYQINSMTTTNGQSPFLSVWMWIDENPQYKKETAILIEEFLKQRIKGLKNEVGVYVTQAFPKLLYCLDEDNITEDSEYWYLTELAAKCTAKRMVPDYISAKKMKELKGDVYPCMGK